MDNTAKIEETVNKFFEAFGKLSPDEKRFFLAEIDNILSRKDESEKKIYLSLIKAARDGKTADETITILKKV
jgi:hypothetical protein